MKKFTFIFTGTVFLTVFLFLPMALALVFSLWWLWLYLPAVALIAFGWYWIWEELHKNQSYNLSNLDYSDDPYKDMWNMY